MRGLLVAAGVAVAVAALTARPHADAAPSGCRLAHGIRHVVYIQFDNTHLLRDRGNVPSDLQQMPHLLNFMRRNGTLLSNDHTVLISHTAGGILSALTGVYPDRHGQGVTNSFRYFKPDGTTATGVAFAYWTDGIFDPTSSAPSDGSFNMVTKAGRNAPAPWVPFTRAGCNWGGVGTANTVLENIGPDVPKVFGADSPEAAEVKADPGQAFADFVGIAVHCRKGAALCSAANRGRSDVLPDEPGGYRGFNGLFGSKYVTAAILHGDVADLNGRPIQDAQGHHGFPGFDGMVPAVSLSYVAELQEHGVPVTYAYVSDAHDDHGKAGEIHRAYGSGEAGYVAQLRSYDDAFAKFFGRLRRDGITTRNTLFVFTVDEGDHVVEGNPSNSSCNGVTTACVWSHVTCSAACPANDVGEINGNIRGLLATQRGNTTPFGIHADMAPAFWLNGNPAPDAALTRTFERDVDALTGTNPYNGVNQRISSVLLDRTGMKALHMVTGDPLRTPTFVMFADPDWFLFSGGAGCSTPCVAVQPDFAYNHGGIANDIKRMWLGMAGPGVRRLNQTPKIWADHTDTRPTMLTLLGLKDDYVGDGRPLVELIGRGSTPRALRAHGATVQRLAASYKSINAPFGAFGLYALATSSNATRTTDDARHARLESGLTALTRQRDALAVRMRAALTDAAFRGKPVNERLAKRWIAQARKLIRAAFVLSNS